MTDDSSFILHQEIPKDCWLIISNNTLSSQAGFNLATGSWSSGWGVSGNYTSYYVYCKNLGQQGSSLGFSNYASLIQLTSIVSRQYTLSSGSWGFKFVTTNDYFFLLDGDIDGVNFKYSSYLSTNMRVWSQTYWGRSVAVSPHNLTMVNKDGSFGSLYDYNNSCYVRPACVIKLGKWAESI